MADISAEQLIDVRRFAVMKATEIATLVHDAQGMLVNAAAIEHFILTGKAAPEAAPASKPAAPTRNKPLRTRK